MRTPEYHHVQSNNRAVTSIALPSTAVASIAQPTPTTTDSKTSNACPGHSNSSLVQITAKAANGGGNFAMARRDSTPSSFLVPAKYLNLSTSTVGASEVLAFEGESKKKTHQAPLPSLVAAPKKVMPLTIISGMGDGRRTYKITNDIDRKAQSAAVAPTAIVYGTQAGNGSTSLLRRSQPTGCGPPPLVQRQYKSAQLIPNNGVLLNGLPLSMNVVRSMITTAQHQESTAQPLPAVAVANATPARKAEVSSAAPATLDGVSMTTLAAFSDTQLLKQNCVATMSRTQPNTDQNGGSNSSTKENSPATLIDDEKPCFLLDDSFELPSVEDDTMLRLSVPHGLNQVPLVEKKQTTPPYKLAINFTSSPRTERAKSLGQLMMAKQALMNERRHSTAISAIENQMTTTAIPSAAAPTVKAMKKSSDPDGKLHLVGNSCTLNNESTAGGGDRAKNVVDLDGDLTVAYMDLSEDKNVDTSIISEDGSISIISLKTEEEDNFESDATVSNNNNNQIITADKEAQHDKKMQSVDLESAAKENEAFVVDSSDDNELEKSLLCDEQISILSNSPETKKVASSTALGATPSEAPKPHSSPLSEMKGVQHLLKIKLPIKNEIPSEGAKPLPSAYKNTLSMVANFNMLTWKERVGSARGTNLSFELNEFNLLQVTGPSASTHDISTLFEVPPNERIPLEPDADVATTGEQSQVKLKCRICNYEGPGSEFLAPEFCSVWCMKRNARKRSLRERSSMPARTGRRPLIDESSASASFELTSDDEVAPVRKYFGWKTYLKTYNGFAAPVHLFLNPFPTTLNDFDVGMKLEAIDPENCSLFCVCTVAAVQGYRLRLHFDGFESIYDFWVNADSMDIFPVGWCERTKRTLQPPRGYSAAKFNWPTYLAKTKSMAAHRHLFTHLNSSTVPTRNPFKIGMHLEAEDLNDTGKLCVATVADVLDDRIRVHFNGWDDCYDYWVEFSSPYIHPCGWHAGNQQLIVPPDYESACFDWASYIRRKGTGIPTHPEQFIARDPIDFTTHMKLEVVDPRNPMLIRPATVVGRNAHRIKLHLDCWPSDYCFWLEDDSPDLHPIGWCEVTFHDLEPPPTYHAIAPLKPCSIVGCRGIGNAKSLSEPTHATIECCPYAPNNWRHKLGKPPRLTEKQIVRKHATPRSKATSSASSASSTSTSPNKIVLSPLATLCAQPQLLLPVPKNLSCLKYVNNIKPRREMRMMGASNVGYEKDYDNELAMLLNIKQEMEASMSSNEQKPDVVQKPTKTSDAVAAAIKKEPAQEELNTSLKIMKSFLSDYGPRLRQNYDIWKRNLTMDVSTIRRNPLFWSTDETCRFVEGALGNTVAAAACASEDIDGASLLLLHQADLTDVLHLKLGPATKLYAIILQLRILSVRKFNVKMST